MILIGYSGHSLVVFDCLKHSHDCVGYLDVEEKVSNPLGIMYLGDENTVDTEKYQDHAFFPAIGDNAIRAKVCDVLNAKKLMETIAVHPTAFVSESAVVGKSTMIGPNATVNAQAKIGRGVIINSRAIIEHECLIEDFVHVAPGAVLAGNVTIKKGAFIGANATMKQGVTIGQDAIIGAGSVVLKDVSNNETWVGNPAKKLNDGK